MKTGISALTLALAFLIAGGVLAAMQQPAATTTGPTPPAWAFPVNPPNPGGGRGAGGGGGGTGQPAAAPADTPRTVPGSSVSMTMAQTRDLFNVPDWHPDNHPPA